jgi:hypothetical protein
MVCCAQPSSSSEDESDAKEGGKHEPSSEISSADENKVAVKSKSFCGTN